MKDLRVSITIVTLVLGQSLALWHFDLIRGIDIALNIAFLIIAWFAFGMTWSHERWGIEEYNQKWHIVAPKIYKSMAIMTIVIPIVSLSAGIVITKYAPVRLGRDMSSLLVDPQESALSITTLPQSYSTDIARHVPQGSNSYLIANTSDGIMVSPTIPMLTNILSKIDSNVRVMPAWITAGLLFVILLFLWVVELATDWRPIGEGGAGSAGSGAEGV